MAGYTRQSTGNIINGSPITAPPLNSEFNQLAAAFNATTGHNHTGGTGDSPKINLTTSVAGYLPIENGGLGGKNKLDATTAPLVTNDASEGYVPGSLWENTTTGRIYICVGNSTGAAVWRELVQVQSGNAILPAANDTVDLGDNNNRFQDLFLSGGISATGNVAAGGTLNITGATALGSTLGVTGDTTLVNLSATGTTTITSIDLNSGAIDSTSIGTTTPAAGTFTTLNANTSLVAATADINGGTVDGATIGASTPSTGAFTDIDASGTATLATVDINAGAIDGTVIGASSHTTGKFTTLQSTGAATLASVNIDGGTIDGATVGATTASSGAFTTVTSSGGITGALTGNVTGNVTGSLSGGTVTGNVTGDLTGNVTAGSGSSSFNDVTISGTLNMDANSAATITNLSAPTNNNDAARKIDVDNAVANLVDSAPDNLNTLNELAAALADDDDAFNTLNTSISTKLPKAGGIMTGAIAMSTNKITGVGDPTAAQDVSSKAYTDAQRDTRLATAGGTMSGEVAMGNNKITGLATPTANTDASSKGYVDGVLGSATVASNSATTATTQAGIATTKAGEAAGSASAALASEQAAAASYDDFDDRYLGAKSSAPTVDNDGDALVIGALYFNSTTNIMAVYGSGGWQSAGSAVNGTSDRQTYIVTTAGQTVFAATYDAGYIDVYLNGVKQLMGTDVTATNGTSVVFASGTAINDIVDIVAYGTFVLADHLTQTQSDARYVNLSGDTMTGALTTTGLTVDGTPVRINSTAPMLNFMESGVTDQNHRIRQNAGNLYFQKLSDDENTATTNMVIDGGTGDISFYATDGTTQAFHWDAADERLGLGVTTPAAPLSISGSAFNPAAGGYATGGIDLQGATSGNGNYTAGLGFRMGTRQSTAIITGVQDTTDSDRVGLAFFTNPDGSGSTAADEVMRISSSGNVGINTGSPSESLTNRGNIFIETNSTSANSGNGLFWQSTTNGWATSTAHAAIYGKRTDASNGYLRFDTRQSGTTEEAMRLSAAGDLELIQSNNLYWKHAGGGTIRAGITADSSDNLTFSTGSSDTTRMTLDGSGNVGIGNGISNPMRPLVLYENSSGQTQIQFQNSTTGTANTDGFGVGLDTNEDGFLWNYEGSDIYLGGSTAARIMTLDGSNGNVGIGTADPTSSYGTNLNVHSSATNGAALHLTDGTTGNTSNDGFHLISTGGLAYVWNREATDMVFGTANLPRMIIDSSGNIEITTTTSGLISAGAARQGSIIKLHHEAQWEAGYNSTPTDFLGAVEFSSGDASGTGLAGEGVRAAIRAYVKDAYNNVGLSFETGGSRAEVMRLDNSGHAIIPAGVTLGTAAGVYAAANTLDSYEEGVWTATDGSGAGLTFTLANNTYTKVGRLVTCAANVVWPSTSNTSLARVTLPFTSVTTNSQQGGVVLEQDYNSTITLVAAINYTDGVIFRPRGYGNLTNANLSGKRLRFLLTYHEA